MPSTHPSATLRALLDDHPGLAQRYTRLRRQAGHLVMSLYEVTDRCNLRCEGCFYFEGPKADRHHPTPPTPSMPCLPPRWRGG